MPGKQSPFTAYGMRRPSEGEERRRVAAARLVGRLLKDDVLPGASEANLDAFSTCKGLFNRVARQDQHDWTVTQFRLGYPSRDRCSRLGDALRECRTAVEENDGEAWAVARLRARSLGARGRCSPIGASASSIRCPGRVSSTWCRGARTGAGFTSTSRGCPSNGPSPV